MKRGILLFLTLFFILSPMAHAQSDSDLWYEDQSRALAQELDVLIRDKSYPGFYGVPERVMSLTDEVQKTDFSAVPQSALRLTLPKVDGLLTFMLRQLAATDEGELSDIAAKQLIDNMPPTLVTLLNGAENESWVLLSAVYNISETFVLPDGFQNAIVLPRYPGDYWIAVSFTQTGDNTGTASASFVQADIQEGIDQLTDSLGGKLLYAFLFKETVYDYPL